MLGGEQEMIDLLFEASIADVLDEYLSDQRLKDALFGQGVIGTWGGPRDPGTASIKLMHYQGDLEGQGPVWGYVEGGMGMISFAIADAAPRGRRDPRLWRAGRRDPSRRGGADRGRDDDPRPDRALQRRPQGRAGPARRRRDRRPPSASGSRPGRSAARSSSSTPRSRGCPTGPPPPGRSGRRGRRSTSPAGSTRPSGPSKHATPASRRSASARSTSRPATTRRRRPPARI